MAVSESAKQAAYIVGGGLAGYVVDNVMPFVNTAVPKMTGILMPSNIVKLVGGIVAPIYAAYGKASPRNRLFAAGVAAYYVPQVIGLARSMVGAPVRFTKVIPSGLSPMPYTSPAATSYGAKIF